MERSQVRRNELHDLRIDFELGQVHGRHLVLPGQRLGELDLLDETELYEVVPDARAVLSLLLKGLVELVLGDEPLAEERITNSLGAVGGNRGGHVASALVVGFFQVKRPGSPPYYRRANPDW